MLPGAGDLRVSRTAAGGDDEGVRGDARLLALLVDGDHRLLVDEARVCVVVLDLATARFGLFGGRVTFWGLGAALG